MKLNNKGFAISTVMYMILILAVILITLTLSTLSSRKLILDKIRQETNNTIYNIYDITYRQALEILKGEATSYANNNNVIKESIKISDLNSSIDEEILDGYKLSEKYLTINKNNNVYDIYLGKSSKVTNLNDDINTFIDIADYKIYGNSVEKQLPSEYEQVEYIESTGTQYINTGVYANNQTGIKIDFQNMATNMDSFGVAKVHKPNVSAFGIHYYYRYMFIYGDNSAIIGTWSQYKNDRIKISAINGTLKLNDSTIATYENNMNSNTSFPITIFASSDSSIHSFGELKLYNCCIYSGNQIIKNFIPCYRKSDNVIGLYDVVNDEFYMNSGSGTFNKGQNKFISLSDKKYTQYVGNMISNSSDLNYNKYNIKISIDSENLNIYLNEPLRCVNNKCDYIDFKNGKVIRKVEVANNSLVELETPIEEVVELPNIENYGEYDSLNIDTDIKPSKVEFTIIQKLRQL